MKTMTSVVLVLVLACTGCKQEAKRVSRETSAMAIKFNELVKAGKTTREQEQAYIDAVAQVTFELDRAIRGTTAAERTQRNAKIEARTGVNPEGPLELNMNDEHERLLGVVNAIVEKAAKDAHDRDMLREASLSVASSRPGSERK